MTLARETTMHQNAVAAGGLVDAIGGIATVVLAICGLVRINPPVLASVATIVFGVALLLQGSASVVDLRQITKTTGSAGVEPGGNVAAVLLVGIAGIVLGILSLLRIDTNVLIPVAIIAYGAGMILGSSAVPQLHALRRVGTPGQRGGAGVESLVSELASMSAVSQSLAGIAAVVLGILVLAGLNYPVLNLVALLELGATLVVTGGALTATVLGVE